MWSISIMKSSSDVVIILAPKTRQRKLSLKTRWSRFRWCPNSCCLRSFAKLGLEKVNPRKNFFQSWGSQLRKANFWSSSARPTVKTWLNEWRTSRSQSAIRFRVSRKSPRTRKERARWTRLQSSRLSISTTWGCRHSWPMPWITTRPGRHCLPWQVTTREPSCWVSKIPTTWRNYSKSKSTCLWHLNKTSQAKQGAKMEEQIWYPGCRRRLELTRHRRLLNLNLVNKCESFPQIRIVSTLSSSNLVSSRHRWWFLKRFTSEWHPLNMLPQCRDT